jgi:hypothetical protein
MAFSWMGVGSDMFIREMAAFVPLFRLSPGNTEAVPAESREGSSFAAGESFGGVSIVEERPLRRALKHGEQ